MERKSRFVYETRPNALRENMVQGGKYRFTILTPSLVRMEYDEKGKFEDRASQSIFFVILQKTTLYQCLIREH